MRRTAIPILILVALALLLYLLWPRSNSGHPQATPGDRRATVEERRAARASGAVDSSPATVSGRVVDRAGSGIGGAMISIAKRNLSRHERSAPGATPEPIVATTRADGRFTVADLAPGRYTLAAAARGFLPGIIDPLMIAPGEQRDDVVVILEPGGNSLRGLVTDVGGGPIAGALVRATSITEGSIFSVFRAPYTAVTDQRGEYRLNLRDGRYWLEVFHTDYVSADRMTEIRGSERVEDFTLTPGAMIFGQVRSRATDKPVADAVVTYRAHGGGRGQMDLAGLGLDTATTDADGRFVLRGLRSGTVALTAFGRGYASRQPTEVPLGIAEQVTGVVVYVETAFTISGFVVDKQDPTRAIDGVLVGAYNFSGAVHLGRDSTAADGYFEILGVQPGSYLIGAAGEDRVLSAMGTNVTVTDRDVDDVVVELERGVVLSGRVEPPMAARLSLEIDAESVGMSNFVQAISAAVVRAQSGDDGNFVLRGVPSGKYTLVATTDDGHSGELALEIADRDLEGLVVELDPRASVSGLVVDATGQPIAGLRVSARPADGRRPGFNIDAMVFGGRGLTGNDGSFTVVGLDPGRHMISVSDDKGQLRWADPEHEDKPDQPIEVVLEPATPVTGLRLVVENRNRQIRGLVVSSGGAPVADAWVTARRISDRPPWADGPRRRESDRDQAGDGDSGDGEAGGQSGGRHSVTVSVGSDGTDVESDDGESDRGDDSAQRRRRRGWMPSEQPVLTGPDGRFVISNLRDGQYELEAEGLKGTERGSLSPVASGSDVTVRLEPLAGISGQVTSHGDPVPDYLIRAEGPSPRNSHVLDPEGHYHLTRLDPGSYSISIIAPKGRATQKVEVAANQTAKKDFDLIAWSSIRGVVKNTATGEPMDGLAVIAFAEEGSDFGQMAMDILSGDGPTTDDQGRFRVGRLGAGKGTVVVVDGDQAGFEIVASKDFTLEPGQDLDLGELQGQSVNAIPKDQRGELAMTTTRATWAGRPRAAGESGDPEPPDGLPTDLECLWVSTVEADGPAAAAGIAVGDRIVAISGAEVSALGARVAEQLLSPRRLRAGQPLPLVIDRDGKRDAVNVVPRPLTD